MPRLSKVEVARGIHWVEVPEADLYVRCGCPADSVKHLMTRGLIRRREMNVFEFLCRGESALVDLNLPRGQRYEAPYPLSYHQIDREYFAVVHSGDGDEWDVNRPCTGGILIFQGKVYLVDAGPSILHGLRALGIGVSEIEGIFHIHAHDDHFGGLTALTRTDRRLKYDATPFVRASVTKKVSALLSIDEDQFASFLEPHDLEIDAWNDIDSLQVKLLPSPHPVEMTIFLFRAAEDNGYRTYAHFCDIAAMKVLEWMLTDDESAPGLSADSLERVRGAYLTQADLKKLDVGGELIHGNATDLVDDPSPRLILSHTSAGLTEEQKQIGSGAAFGSLDVLIPSEQEDLRRRARKYLSAYFPTAPDHQLETVLNNPIVTINPEMMLARAGEAAESIYLVLSGEVEVLRPDGAGLPHQLREDPLRH